MGKFWPKILLLWTYKHLSGLVCVLISWQHADILSFSILMLLHADFHQKYAVAIKCWYMALVWHKSLPLHNQHWLYSGRTEHFWPRATPILTKVFEMVFYMEKLKSSSSEHVLVIRVCQKCQKCKKREYPGFWGNFGYISKTEKSISMIFWHKTP